MSSPGRPRAARGGRPEPEIMIAPALPGPAAGERLLREAARAAAPAVTIGIWVVEPTAAAAAVVAAVWRKLPTAPEISCPPASTPWSSTFWITTGAAIVLKMIQNAITR